VSRSALGSPPDLGHDLPEISATIWPDISRVDYAVDLMVVLRCTKQLLLRLKQFDDVPTVASTTRLGDWYGNLLRMGNRHALLFISERSRLPVMIPVRQANRLRSAFPDAVCQILGAVGVPAEAIENERLQMSEIAFGRTRSRSSWLIERLLVDGPHALHHETQRVARAHRPRAGRDATDSAVRW
jgi:hypothetical protein